MLLLGAALLVHGCQQERAFMKGAIRQRAVVIEREHVRKYPGERLKIGLLDQDELEYSHWVDTFFYSPMAGTEVYALVNSKSYPQVRLAGLRGTSMLVGWGLMFSFFGMLWIAGALAEWRQRGHSG